MNRDELLTILREQQGVCQQLGFEALALFGSYARDEMTGTSDVDILYLFADGAISLKAVLDLQDLLISLLGKQPHLVSRRYINPILRDAILEEAILVYGNMNLPQAA